jgi:hypothetical protein
VTIAKRIRDIGQPYRRALLKGFGFSDFPSKPKASFLLVVNTLTYSVIYDGRRLRSIIWISTSGSVLLKAPSISCFLYYLSERIILNRK